MINLNATDLQIISVLLLGIIVILLIVLSAMRFIHNNELRDSQACLTNHIEYHAQVLEKKYKENKKLRNENVEIRHDLKIKQDVIEDARKRIGRLLEENKVIGELRAHNFELSSDIRKASEEMSNQWINSISHAITTTNDYSKLAAKLNTEIHDYILVQYDLTQTKENK